MLISYYITLNSGYYSSILRSITFTNISLPVSHLYCWCICVNEDVVFLVFPLFFFFLIFAIIKNRTLNLWKQLDTIRLILSCMIKPNADCLLQKRIGIDASKLYLSNVTQGNFFLASLCSNKYAGIFVCVGDAKVMVTSGRISFFTSFLAYKCHPSNCDDKDK